MCMSCVSHVLHGNLTCDSEKAGDVWIRWWLRQKVDAVNHAHYRVTAQFGLMDPAENCWQLWTKGCTKVLHHNFHIYFENYSNYDGVTFVGVCSKKYILFSRFALLYFITMLFSNTFSLFYLQNSSSWDLLYLYVCDIFKHAALIIVMISCLSSMWITAVK